MNSIDGPFLKSSTLTYRTRDDRQGRLFFCLVAGFFALSHLKIKFTSLIEL